MGKDAVAAIAIITTAIIVGLVMRFGATSVPIAGDIQKTTTTGLADLTLQGNGYPYYGPGETPQAG